MGRCLPYVWRAQRPSSREINPRSPQYSDRPEGLPDLPGIESRASQWTQAPLTTDTYSPQSIPTASTCGGVGRRGPLCGDSYLGPGLVPIGPYCLGLPAPPAGSCEPYASTVPSTAPPSELRVLVTLDLALEVP